MDNASARSTHTTGGPILRHGWCFDQPGTEGRPASTCLPGHASSVLVTSVFAISAPPPKDNRRAGGPFRGDRTATRGFGNRPSD